MAGYARMCGAALARAHAKTGDAAMIEGYLRTSEKFEDAIGAYAVAYADQVNLDDQAFAAAAGSGRVKSDVSTSELVTMLR